MAKQQQPAETTKTTIRFPKALVVAAKHRAIDENIDLQDLVVKAVQQYLERKGTRNHETTKP